MGEVKQGAVVMELPYNMAKALVVVRGGASPIAQFLAKYKKLQNEFKAWLAKQPLSVEATVVTLTSATQGAAIGALMGTLFTDFASSFHIPSPGSPNLNPEAMAALKKAQAFSGFPFMLAGNFAVMNGVNDGISCVMKRLKGEEDVQSSMVAAFGSGVMFSLVGGMGGPNATSSAISYGLLFAVVQGGLFQLGQRVSQRAAEDDHYVKAKSMLSNLGLEKYERNFKKGLLTDNTLPLLTDSALSDARIPPGPRLLILDHIERKWHSEPVVT